MSEGLFSPIEGCVCLHGMISVVLHLFAAQQFGLSNVYIFILLIEISHCQSYKH